MKQHLISLALILNSCCLMAQLGEWTWMKGLNTTNSLGVYGTQGTPAAGNMPPASYESCQWTDLNGNFWLFGGDQGTGLIASLWKFDPATNQWVWMKGPNTLNQPGIYGTQGVPSSANYPGSRAYGSTTWTDNAGNLWMLGGGGFDAVGTLGGLNDLWRYNISTNQWTWMKGSNLAGAADVYGTKGVAALANTPGARQEAVASWVDNINGDLWFFGGADASSSGYSDLWKYNISTNQWTWMKGPGIVGQPGTYGTKGVSAPANNPPARFTYSHWKDANGNFWLFGSEQWFGFHNDLWKYTVSTNEWTWMNGPSTPTNGSFGTKCVYAGSNLPPSRMENRACWQTTSACGELFWLFGGTSSAGDRNDLWCYSTALNRWVWVSGSNTAMQPGVYGTITVSAPTNVPGARIGSVSWKDNSGNLWLFGGQGGPGGGGWRNDLWRFVINPSCVCPPLPIELLSFNVKCTEQKTAEIKWSTSSESNNAYFTVEKSTNNDSDWIAVGTVNSAENPSNKYYHLVDEDPFSGIRYYRLKQTDYNGVSGHVASAVSNCDNLVSQSIIFLTLSDEELNFQIASKASQDIEIRLYDAVGRLVFKDARNLTKGVNNLSYTVSPSASGVYILNIKTKEESLNQKLVKF